MIWGVKVEKDLKWVDEQKQLVDEVYTKTHLLFNKYPVYQYQFKNNHKNVNKDDKKVGFQNGS